MTLRILAVKPDCMRPECLDIMQADPQVTAFVGDYLDCLFQGVVAILANHHQLRRDCHGFLAGRRDADAAAVLQLPEVRGNAHLVQQLVGYDRKGQGQLAVKAPQANEPIDRNCRRVRQQERRRVFQHGADRIGTGIGVIAYLAFRDRVEVCAHQGNGQQQGVFAGCQISKVNHDPSRCRGEFFIQQDDGPVCGHLRYRSESPFIPAVAGECHAGGFAQVVGLSVATVGYCFCFFHVINSV